jgi:hypothetical protein
MKQKNKAILLTEMWDSYFPTLPVGHEFWMVALEDFPLGALIKAIKYTARKRVHLRGNMTLDQMLAYLESSCNLTLRDEIAAGIYKPDQFRNRTLVKVAAPSAATSTVTDQEEASWNK